MGKTTFTHNGEQWKATASKEYGASKTVYKSSYSKTKEEFGNFEAGMLDHAKAAAKALGIIE